MASILSILLSAVLAWGAPAPDPSKKKPLVFVDQVKSSQLYDLLTYPARLIPRVNAPVLSETEGVVQRLLAPLGARVRKGEKLFVVKNTDPVYQYAAVATRAPVSGVVSAVDVTEGSRVSRGQRILQITDPDQVRITVEVAVSDLGAVKAGLPGELFLTGFESPLPVEISGVSPYVDAGTGTATAELSLIGKSAKLLPGIVGKVTFKARTRQGIQIPEHAVAYQGRNPFVRVVDDGKAKFVPVTLGSTRQGLVEIVKGITDDQTIILRSSTFVADGEPVQVETQKPAGKSE